MSSGVLIKGYSYIIVLFEKFHYILKKKFSSTYRVAFMSVNVKIPCLAIFIENDQEKFVCVCV